jgi:hypothetical protein
LNLSRDGNMGKHRILFTLSLFLLASLSLLVWHFRVIFYDLYESRNSTPARISKENGGRQAKLQQGSIGRSLATTSLTMSPADMHSSDMEMSSETGLATLLEQRPNTDYSQEVPTSMIPPGVNPKDIEISSETGLATLLEQRPNTDYSQEVPMVMIPPGVNPKDIEISSETGLATLKQTWPDTGR